MLILSRKIGERIVIGGSIVVTVLEGRGKRVRLGIEAPPGISIQREELLTNNKSSEEAHEAVGAAAETTH
jgi:carbon storage regulator